jgi:amino acid transporter
MGGLHAYKRGIGPIGLMFSAVSAMLGSGWLFSMLYVGQLAGPASIIAWLIGGALVFLIAFTYGELSTMVPITGGSARFPQLTHGTFISLFFGWITWFTLMTAPAIETQAMVQYMANYWPGLLAPHRTSFGLSLMGYVVATAAMLIFTLINIYSIRFITRMNNILSIWKIVVPVLTGLTLIVVAFHKSNFSNPQYHGFMPYGWHGVFMALASGGILFAFNGFKQIVELAGEAKNPKKTLLISIVGSLLIALAVYSLLQIAFVGALKPEQLAHGWINIHFSGDAGPLAGMLLAFGLNWMAVLLYATATAATGGAGLVYSTSAARILYGMSANRQLPMFLQEVTTKGVPARAVVVNFVLAMTFFLPFHGWLAMAQFMSSIIALSYITGPVCCLCLRYQLPDHERGIRLPFIKLWSYVAFLICTLVVYWTGWHVVSKLGLCVIASLILFTSYRLLAKRARAIHMHWRETLWLWPYLMGLSIISELGNFGGGQHVLRPEIAYLLLALLSGVSLYLAVKFRSNDAHVRYTMARYEEEAKSGVPMTVPDEDEEDIKQPAADFVRTAGKAWSIKPARVDES